MLSTDGVCFALDDNGQLRVPLVRIAGVDAVRQGVNSRIKLFKREWFLDQSEGVPWIEDEDNQTDDFILGAAYNEEKARYHVRKAILSTPATSAEGLTMTLVYDGTSRTLDIEYNVNAVFEDVPTSTPVTGTVTLEF